MLPDGEWLAIEICLIFEPFYFHSIEVNVLPGRVWLAVLICLIFEQYYQYNTDWLRCMCLQRLPTVSCEHLELTEKVGKFKLQAACWWSLIREEGSSHLRPTITDYWSIRYALHRSPLSFKHWHFLDLEFRRIVSQSHDL